MKLKFYTAIAAAMLAGSAMAVQARDLTVVSWGGTYQDAQREIFFKPYIEKSGKPLLDEAWDGGYGILQAKVKAGEPNWDVVQVEAEELALGCADGIYEKLDWDRIGGREAYIPSAVDECGVGTIVWSTGIGYDADRLEQAPQSWADFWDREKFPGKRSLRKGPKYALEFALMADGVPAEEVYDVLRAPGGVDRAFNKLDELKSDIIWWDSAAQSLQLISSGQVAMSSTYNGRITGIKRSEGRNLGFTFPQSIYAIDSWVILKGSPNVEAGLDFIAYASQPENMAKLPQYVAYGLPRIEANDFVEEQYKLDLPTAPANLEQAIAIDVDYWTDNIEELTQRFNAWLAQ